MPIDNRLKADLEDIVRQRELLRADQQALRQTHGGHTFDSMEARVTKLETHMEYVRADLAEIKSSLANVTGSIDGLRQDIRDTKLAAQEARLEAIATKAHSVGKTTLFLTALSIVAVILAAMAFGGDRFDGGLNAASIAEQAATRAIAAQPQ